MKYLLLLTFLSVLSSCDSSFQDQSINDIKTKIPSGICTELPKGTHLSNIVLGKIIDIGLDGMTGVSYKFDYEINGHAKHKISALRYIKSGYKYIFASMGSDCDYELK